MIEPLLSVTLPDRLVVGHDHQHAPQAEEKVIVLGQTYGNVSGQNNLAEACRVLGRDGSVRLIAVEGAMGPVQAPSRPASVAELVQTGSDVSAGVLSLLQESATAFEAWGVDDLDLVRRSHEAMARVNAVRSRVQRGFAAAGELHRLAQAAAYPPGIAELRAGSLRFTGRSIPLSRQVELLSEEAARAGVPLSGFPAIQSFQALRRDEARLRPRRVQRQAEKFLDRLFSRVYGWFRLPPRWRRRSGPTRIDIDLRKAQPVLEYWQEATGRSEKELHAALKEQGPEPVFLACKGWYEQWLPAAAQQRAALGQLGAASFWEELFRLALRLDVEFFDLLDLRRSVAMRRRMNSARQGMVDELAMAARSLAAGLGGAAAELLKLENRLDLLYRALRLEVPLAEVDEARFGAGELSEQLRALARLASRPLPSDLERDALALDGALADAQEFWRLSVERGETMAERTVERLRQRPDDRAILVVGGFHDRTVRRALERAGVSWSSIAVQVDLSELEGR